jgi:hypothetical protein
LHEIFSDHYTLTAGFESDEHACFYYYFYEKIWLKRFFHSASMETRFISIFCAQIGKLKQDFAYFYLWN